MGDLRVGVIGANGIGQAHLFAAPAVDGEILAAVCDLDQEVLTKASDDHGVAPFPRAEDLFGSGAIDAVVIATPPGTHAGLIRGALAAGLHVYCEKPFVATAEEGWALGSEAAAMGRVLHIGHQYRFHRGYAEARRKIAAGEIGSLFRADLVATNWFRAQRYFEVSPWRATWKMSGGGVLLSQACHQVDAYLQVMGLPSRVTARALRSRHVAEVEDEIVVLCEWESGARGVVTASLNDPVGADRMEWHGELGSIVAEDYELRQALLPAPAQELSDTCEQEFPEIDVPWEQVDVLRSPSEWFDMVLDSHRDFVAAIDEDRPSSCDAAEASRVIEFANAAYLSAVRGEPVQVSRAAGEYAGVYRQLCNGTAVISDMGVHE